MQMSKKYYRHIKHAPRLNLSRHLKVRKIGTTIFTVTTGSKCRDSTANNVKQSSLSSDIVYYFCDLMDF